MPETGLTRSKSDLTLENETIFSRSYWTAAAEELKRPRSLAIAAMLVALRVLLHIFTIPIIPQTLFISAEFIPDALGGMICGPFMALISGAAADIIGTLLNPSNGSFYFPFTFLEMLGSFIYAIFLYRAKPSPLRLFLSRLSNSVIINIIGTPILLSFMYGKSIYYYMLSRVAKNLLLFPIEALALTVIINALQPVMCSMGLISKKNQRVKITIRHLAALAVLFLISLLSIWIYYNLFLTK